MWSIHIVCLLHPYSSIWKSQEYNTLFQDDWNYFVNQVLIRHEKKNFISWDYWLDGLSKLLFIVLVPWTFRRQPFSLNNFCRMFHTPAAAQVWENHTINAWCSWLSGTSLNTASAPDFAQKPLFLPGEDMHMACWKIIKLL